MTHHANTMNPLGLSPQLNAKLENAIALHQSGRLKEAEIEYLSLARIIAPHPRLYSALGSIACQLGNPERGVQLLEKSLEMWPEQRGVLADQALGLLLLGRFDEALARYDQLLVLQPSYARAHNNRGIVLEELNRLDEAIESYDQAIAIKVDYAEAYINRGNALRKLDRNDEALCSYDQAIAFKEDYAEAYINRGNALQDIERYEDALADYDRAILLDSHHARAYSNRAIVLSHLGRSEEAVASCDYSIALAPKDSGVHFNRGKALQDLGKLKEALISYDRAIALNGNDAFAHNNRGNVLYALGALHQARESYERAVELVPSYAEAYAGLGMALARLDQPEQAIVFLEKALSLRPDAPFVLGKWLSQKMLGCSWEKLDFWVAEIVEKVSANSRIAIPFELLPIPSSLAQQLQCARSLLVPAESIKALPLYQGLSYGHDRIKVGYFSSEFHNHPVAHLTAELFERHDRSKFEIVAFSFDPAPPDAWRVRLEQAFDQFIDVTDKSDREIAELVRSLEIDIAIDLNGFSGFFRAEIFAYRPAPVQVNYLGYAGTMGAPYFDYIIADEIVIPPEHREFYSEQIAYLPHSYMVNDSTKSVSNTPISREQAGLPAEGFVFCAFNNSYKITPDVFDIWMRLLARIEGSVLWLRHARLTTINNLRREAEQRGVSPDRLIFAPRIDSLADHLARHRLADLFLDTFYYNAHTTASDALWAGLPVLTCLGETFASRVAASLLNAIGMPELITHSHVKYESLAYALASNPARLMALREKLATNRLTTPLFDTVIFTQNIESMLAKMHQRAQRGLPPQHIWA